MHPKTEEVRCHPVDDVDDQGSSASSSTEGHVDGNVMTLGEINNLTQYLLLEEAKLRQQRERQELAKEAIMRSRRETLRERTTLMQHRLPSSREPVCDDYLADGITQPTGVKIVQDDDSFTGSGASPKKKMRAFLPWKTRVWQSIYNGTRYLLVSMSYTSGVTLYESHALREYYQQEVYD